MRPTVEYAYTDMIDLGEQVPLGIMREIHRWGSSNAMVLAVWLHMFRVFMTGSYKPPREFNWVVGGFTAYYYFIFEVLLVTCCLGINWQFGPVTVGSNMARAHPFYWFGGPRC